GSDDLDDNQLRLEQEIMNAIDDVKVINEYRIMSRYLDLIKATLRTNFYQAEANGQSKGNFSIKFNPRQIPELPKPEPKFEIFV
ncbi:NAD-glutamate dehydrogenase domain-containing protein, partial [Pseudomonas syringae group genomosp. 7]|uniref:NAD-glutamate dehydrogenase domain-containing protein n=1 Tax=Pseudomonas syringae group genomosp. 7 TaxID=251699 RepID=UPI003770327D